MSLTPASLNLFKSLAEDAPNWSGNPLVEVSPEEKGNLTQLKRAGLLTTDTDRNRVDGLIQVTTWAHFTKKGIALMAELGIPWYGSIYGDPQEVNS